MKSYAYINYVIANNLDKSLEFLTTAYEIVKAQ